MSLKITQLNEILAANVDAANDVLTLVDVSDTSMALTGTNKKIRVGQLLSLASSNPAGSDGEVQFNNAGAFGASSNFYFDKINNRISVGIGTAPTAVVDVQSQGGLFTDRAIRVRHSSVFFDQFIVHGNGQVTVRSSSYDVSVGFANTISNNGNVVYGRSNQASGIDSTAVGIGNQSSGVGSTAVGIGNQSSGANSTAVGIGNQSSGVGSTAVGIGNQSSGANSTAVGIGNQSSGANSTAVGIGNQSSGANSTAVGYNTQSGFASNNSVIGIGNNCLFQGSNADYSLGIGIFSTNGNPDLCYRGNYLNHLLLGYSSVDSEYVNTGSNWLAIANGTAPTASNNDAFMLYSQNIVAGNAAPHFRTSNGSIIRLYEENNAVASAAFIANTGANVNDNSTFGGYTIGQIVQALKNFGLLQ